jgi:acetoin utilization deacetylase AcuC-like enzyme
MNRVALFTHAACLAHDPGAGHPESPARLRAITAALEHPDFAALIRAPAPQATEAQLRRAHPADYVKTLLSFRQIADIASLDADTHIGPGSIDAALHAAGGAIAAVDAILQGHADTAFSATRPPGHHAEASQAMGFCFFSTAAIAALHARHHWHLQRVAIVDFDVHHGNGTQHILQSDRDFLYISSHQSPCYPGTGAARETGVANNVVNLPLAPGDGSHAFRAAWQTRGIPALKTFAPDFLIISAGFDAHRADPLAAINLEADDFAWITDELMQASGGRLISLLEGGYDLAALAECTAVHVKQLMTGKIGGAVPACPKPPSIL